MRDFDQTPNSRFMIAITMRYIEPWSSIYTLGQLPTFVTYAKKIRIPVIKISSKEPPKFLDLYDSIRERIRFQSRAGRIQGYTDRLWLHCLSKEFPTWDLIEDELKVNSYSTYFLFQNRNKALFNWFLEETNFNFLFRTNCSNYINLNYLSSYIDSLDSMAPFMGGHMVGGKDGFISGSGILINREAIRRLVEGWSKLRLHMIEDVALSFLARDLGINLSSVPMVEVFSSEDFFKLSDSQLLSCYQFRCKGLLRPHSDITAMNSLHDRLRSLGQVF